MIDFKEIPEAHLATGNQDRFEFFAREFLAQFYEIVKEPSRGSDGGTGVDLIVEEKLSPDKTVPFKWFVSCKHKAHSGKSVYPTDDPNIRDRVDAEHCDGFMTFYSTGISSGLNTILEGLKDKIKIKQFYAANIEQLLSERKELESVFKSYFPNSYSKWSETKEIQIELSDKNLPSFTAVRVPAEESKNADRFYDGFKPNWEELKAGFDIARDIYTKSKGIKQILEEQIALNDSTIKLFAINGVGGSGKSSLLKRISYDLSEVFDLVFYLNTDWNCHNITVQEQIRTIINKHYKNIFIIIDDVVSLINDNAINLQALMELEKVTNIFFIVSDHPDRLHHVLKELKLPSINNLFEFNLFQLSNKECEALAEKINSLEEAEKLTVRHRNMTVPERLKLCLEDSNRHFVVAMLQIRYGQNFRNIIIDEYNSLFNENIKKAYELICLFNIWNLQLPENLVLTSCYEDEYYGAKDLQKHLIHVIEFEKFGYSARHPIVAREIYFHVYNSPTIVSLALKLVFNKLDVSYLDQRDFIKQFLQIPSIHKRFARVLNKEESLIKNLLTILEARIINTGRELSTQLLSFIGMVNRVLGNDEFALGVFNRILRDFDPNHNFAIRQIAWINHDLGNWEEAAKWAMRSAELTPDFAAHQLQTAKILSLNTVDNFQRAKKYFERAKELDSNNAQVSKSYETYLEAERVLQYFSSLYEDDIIPDDILKMLRPGLAFFKVYYGINTREYNKKLISVLSMMEELPSGSIDDLKELVEGVNLNNNKIIKAKYLCNLGRLMYLEWYHNSKILNPSEIKDVFKESLKLNNQDPFTYCWLGTYYKEAEKNYEQARREYESAIAQASSSKFEYEKNHPLFENNLGLLLMDQVKYAKANKKLLREAAEYLQKAVDKNKDYNLDFYWAKYNFDECSRMLEQDD